MNTGQRLNAQISRPSLSRKHPLIHRGGSTAAEFCGGITAGCAAILCCCPCGLLNLFVLAVIKVPAGICRRTLLRRRRKRQIKHEPPPPAGHTINKRCRCGCGDSEIAIHHLGMEEEEDETAAVVATLEKEMLDRFYGGGFWRSNSQIGTLRTGLLRGPSQKETV